MVSKSNSSFPSLASSRASARPPPKQAQVQHALPCSSPAWCPVGFTSRRSYLLVPAFPGQIRVHSQGLESLKCYTKDRSTGIACNSLQTDEYTADLGLSVQMSARPRTGSLRLRLRQSKRQWTRRGSVRTLLQQHRSPCRKWAWQKSNCLFLLRNLVSPQLSLVTIQHRMPWRFVFISCMVSQVCAQAPLCGIIITVVDKLCHACFK